MSSSFNPSRNVVTSLYLAISVAVGSPQVSAADSIDLLSDARAAQTRFERLRVYYSPQSWWSGSGPCDERVGRFCLRFGRESEEEGEDRPAPTPRPESEEITDAREDLLETLARIGEAIPGDPWVAGQRVSYLAETQRWDEALEVAWTCEAQGWWCQGLAGIALNGLGRTSEAEAAFREVLSHLPPEEREEWEDPSMIADRELSRWIRDLDEEEREREWERVWKLAHPLFILGGNPVWTEHMSRWMLSLTREDARNGHAMRWGSDMTELLVRYGPVVAYERTREPMGYLGPPLVIGRYDPVPRNLFPAESAVLEPATSDPVDWLTHQRRTRSRHAPALARRIHTMDVQVARFRRGEDLLIAAAWELLDVTDNDVAAPGSDASVRSEDADTVQVTFPPEELRSALFVLDEDEMEPLRFMAPPTGPTGGVATAVVPAGRYLISMEALDPKEGRGWRSRRGTSMEPRHRQVVQLSDLLVVAPAQRPETSPPDANVEDQLPLDSLLLRAHPHTRFAPQEIEVAWEVYGLSGTEGVVRFEITATREDRGLFRRAGEALGLLSSRDPVRLRWEEGVSRSQVEGDQPYLRSVVLDLSGLDDGEYELEVAVTPPGRTAATSTREIVLRTPSDEP